MLVWYSRPLLHSQSPEPQPSVGLVQQPSVTQSVTIATTKCWPGTAALCYTVSHQSHNQVLAWYSSPLLHSQSPEPQPSAGLVQPPSVTQSVTRATTKCWPGTAALCYTVSHHSHNQVLAWYSSPLLRSQSPEPQPSVGLVQQPSVTQSVTIATTKCWPGTAALCYTVSHHSHNQVLAWNSSPLLHSQSP